MAQTRNAKNKRSVTITLPGSRPPGLRQLAENSSCGCRVVRNLPLTFAAILGAIAPVLEPLRQILVEAGFQEISSEESKHHPSPIDQMP